MSAGPSTSWPGRPYWEVTRGGSAFLRLICADCHLLNAEHQQQFWGCAGRWIHQPSNRPY